MDKIPFYNLLNMLFVGLVGLISCSFIAPYGLWSNWRFLQALINNSTIEIMLFLSFAYLMGLVVNRMGSCFIEDLLKTENGYDELPYPIKKIRYPWRKYELYALAQRQDAALKFLTREYVLSRNMAMLCVVLTVVAVVCSKYICAAVFLSNMLLFNISMRKYVKKIVKRIDVCLSNRS